MFGKDPHSRQRDINAVLDDQDDLLMAMPGVIGVYVGLLKDQKTPCLKVLVTARTSELERAIPRTLEGYPVVIEVTDKIRPLNTR
jgi:hypothetical protein